jgi:hypothetical protein
MTSAKNVNIKNHDDKQKDISINEFDLNQMIDNAAILMISKRGDGKKIFIHNILNHFKQKSSVRIIISPSDKMINFYTDYLPESCIYYELKPEIIQNLLERQIWIIKKAKERKKQGKYTNTKAFIIMDDCLSSKGDWEKEQSVSTLLFNNRLYHITFLLTMQYPMEIKPELKANFDYIFLFNDDAISNQKRIYEHYAGIFPTFESFRQVFNQLTLDLGAMIIENRGTKDDIAEKVYYYEAKKNYTLKKLNNTQNKKNNYK